MLPQRAAQGTRHPSTRLVCMLCGSQLTLYRRSLKFALTPQRQTLNGGARKKSGVCHVAHFVAVLLNKQVEVRPPRKIVGCCCSWLSSMYSHAQGWRWLMPPHFPHWNVLHVESLTNLCMTMPVCFWPFKQCLYYCKLLMHPKIELCAAIRLVFSICAHTDLLGG